MRKYKYLCLAVVCSLAAYGFVAYMNIAVTTVESILQWDLKSASSPVDRLDADEQGALGWHFASVATDKNGYFYVIGHKDKVLHVVVVDTKGKVIKTFPLHRKDGRAIRYESPYFSVNESGSRLWILRRPVEDMTGRFKWLIPYHVLCVFDSAGKPLQEWKHSGGQMQLQTVGENAAYVADEEGQTSIYRIGQSKPEQFDLAVGVGDFIDSQGQMWRIEGKKQEQDRGQPADREYVVSAQEIGKPVRVAFTFKRSRREGRPFIFWHEPGTGLYFWTYPVGDDGYRVSGSANMVYKVSLLDIQKLFNTADLLAPKGELSVKAQRMLKADKEGNVWMEVGYFEKNGRLREYQIVKVSPPRPRWHTWIN